MSSADSTTAGAGTQPTREALLDSGAVIPLAGGEAPAEREDILQARAYRHPALDDRVVVRLVPSSLGEAEDLTMEFLGFDRPGAGADANTDADADTAISEPVADVGIVLRKSLGFPAWALVNDPANGHHALALVKEIERLGRLARNKPGAAKDGFDALGKRLAAAVPHFLPSYYEQVGRAYLAAENKNYAATMFTKARDAERAHGLPVDEDVLAESFLEFALNGALPAKAVSEYAKALSARTAAPEAFQRFRLLVTERTSGGLPPYAGLNADMKRLAKAAGLDVVEEELSLLRELIDQPALTRAAKPFWASYTPSLVRLAKAEPEVRGKLLALNPALPGTANRDADVFWLGLLADCGALDALTAPADADLYDKTVPAAARPADGAAGWLGRFVKNRSRGWGWYRTPTRLPELLDLVERMAPRLRAEGSGQHGSADAHSTGSAENTASAANAAGAEITPLEIVVAGRVDIDLVDLCLDLGLAVAVPEDLRSRRSIDLGDWLDDRDTPGRRPLAVFSADEHFGPLLDGALDVFASQTPYNGNQEVSPLASRFAELKAVPGLLAAVSRWLDRRAAEVDGGGFPHLDEVLTAIRKAVSAPVVAVNPEPLRRVAAFDVAPLLAESLRAGILDEFSWPALDAACAKLMDADGKQSSAPAAGTGQFDVVEQWPYLVVRKGANIAVVDGTGTVLEHTSAIPAGTGLWNSPLRYADGQLLVTWNGPGSKGAYWSGDQLRALDPARLGYLNTTFASLEAPGGGRTWGGLPLRAGDADIDQAASVDSDGTTYWRRESGQDEPWKEFDPATGRAGRTSMPSFFEDALPSGHALLRQLCWVRPAAPGTEHSPMGAAHGLLGWRVHRSTQNGQGAPGHQGRAGGPLFAEAPDGRAVRLTPSGDVVHADVPVGRVSFPGADTPRVLTVGNNGWGRWHALSLVELSDTGFGSRKLAHLPVGERAPKFAKGTWCVPPLSYWNYLVPRDEAGSRFLRSVGAVRARALMEAAKTALKGRASAQEVSEAAAAAGTVPEYVSALGHVIAAVAAELPEVTHPNLLAGIAGLVHEAVAREADVARIAELLDAPAEPDDESEAADPRLSRPVWDDELVRAVMGLASLGSSYSSQPAPPGVALSWLVSAFHGRDISKQFAEGDKVLQAVEMLPALAGLAYRAGSPLTAEGTRRILAELVAGIAASGILESGTAIRGIRSVRLDTPEVKRTDNPGRVLRTPNGCVVLCATGGEWRDSTYAAFWRGVQLSSADTFDTEAGGWPITTVDTVAQWPAGELERLAGLLASGPFAVPDTATGRLAEATGLSSAEALLALAALPGLANYSGGKLDTETRNRLGLKPPQAKAALGRFDKISRPDRAALVAALAGADVAELWERGPDVEGAAAWWVAKYGKKAAVSEELLTEAHTALKPREAWRSRLPVADVLQGVADLGAWKALHEPAATESGLDEYELADIARALLWLAYRLPYGDPLRDNLPEAARLTRARLCDPAVRLNSGHTEGLAKMETALGVRAVPIGSGAEKGLLRVGPFRARPTRDEWFSTQVAPAELSGPDDPALQLMVVMGPGGSHVPLLRTVLDESFGALMVAPGAEAGGPYPAQDPARSVPHLVEQAAAHLKLSADAAALYLMLLALPDPTDRNTAAWTGWKPARMKAARAELGATPLVVTGSRPRAGRSMFLPGGWHPLKAPALPVETWKSRWLGVDAQAQVALDVTVPRTPVPALFEAAWQRVLDGDPPRLEELQTGRRR